MASSQPVIFLITGAWHLPEHYSQVSHGLRHQGYTVECPLLKTNNNANPPHMTLDDDIHQIRSLAMTYLNTGRDIVVLMHSYGGVVGSNAFAGLGPNDERPEGLSGYVQALVYMTAFIPFEHESLADIFGGGLPPFLSPNSQGLIDIHNPQHHFYNDLDPAAQNYNASLLAVHPTVAQFQGPREPTAFSAWRSIPAKYLMCTEDQALPVEVQEMMVARIEKEQQGLVVEREYLAAGHSPFLSMPNSVVEYMRRVCESGQEPSQQEPRRESSAAAATVVQSNTPGFEGSARMVAGY